MAVYRVHRKEWEKGNKILGKDGEVTKKRKRAPGNLSARSEDDDDVNGDERMEGSSKFPGGGRKGVSSGLSTVIRRNGGSGGEKTKWWKELGGVSKGSMSLKTG